MAVVCLTLGLTLVGGAAKRATHVGNVPAPYSSAVWLSVNGNDSSCKRNNPSLPCATFDHAFQLADSGGAVVVSGGLYPASDETAPESNAPANTIYPAAKAKSAAVTFICQGDGDVTFDAPNFAFYPGASEVTFNGGCFHFNAVAIGYGGYPAQTRDIKLVGVHMATVECNGCADTTISNSEIGPMIDCYAGDVGSADCDPSDSAYGEAYWAAHGGPPVAADSVVAFFHYGAAGLVQNMTLDHDRFHDFNTRDSTNLHVECLFLWGFQGVTLSDNTFERCATFDLFVSAEVTSTNLTMIGNTFGPPVKDLDQGGTLQGVYLEKDWRDVQVATFPTAALTNWFIQGNRFSHGLALDANNVGPKAIDNVVVTGNILGSNTTCTPNVTFDVNVFVGKTCGTRAMRLARFPYVDYLGGDLQVSPGTRVPCFLSAASAPALYWQLMCKRQTALLHRKP